VGLNLNKDNCLNLYKKMLLIRKFEEKVSQLYAEGEIPGFVHLYIGEEAIAVGVCSNLNKDDFITSTHRGHGHLIAKGGNPSLMMAELFGKKTGYCKGKGGSMHIADLDLGILGANGIVGGGIPIAVGAAYSAYLRGTSQVTVAFFGDGASNKGVFHEALNMSSAWSLPMVFVCENNQFGVSTRISRITNVEDLSKRAVGYGIPGIRVNGNDVLAVQDVSKVAIDRARRGKGPTLIVADTWRHHGHFEGENVNYCTKEERNIWKEKCPILYFSNFIKEKFKLTNDDLKKYSDKIDNLLKDAVSFARESDFPAPEEALDDLFYSIVGEKK
jgi:pyruvate dehydrogenase E1 component alpha subunit